MHPNSPQRPDDNFDDIEFGGSDRSKSHSKKTKESEGIPSEQREGQTVVHIDTKEVHIVTTNVDEEQKEPSKPPAKESDAPLEDPTQEMNAPEKTVEPKTIPDSEPESSTEEPKRSLDEKQHHRNAKKMAENDAELKYFLGLVDKTLLEIDKYSDALPESEKEQIKKQFEADIAKIYKVFTPNAKPHDIALDYRFPDKLQTIKLQLKSIAERTWPGETTLVKRNAFVAWIQNAINNEVHPLHHFKETQSREQIRDLLEQIRNAQIDGKREQTHKRIGAVLAGTIGVVLGIGIEKILTMPSAETRQLQTASDVSESFTVEQVQGRKIKIKLPELPEGLVRYDIRAANPSDKIAILVDSFDPVSGVLTLPNNVQPFGGSVHLQVQVMISGQGKSILSSQKTVDGVGPVR